MSINVNKGDTLAHADDIVASYEPLALHAWITVGGDGSLKIIQQLATLSNSLLVGIPNTINIVMM